MKAVQNVNIPRSSRSVMSFGKPRTILIAVIWDWRVEVDTEEALLGGPGGPCMRYESNENGG